MKGQLKIKRREDQKSNVWERFGEVVKEDDSSASDVMCDDYEAQLIFDSHKMGLPLHLERMQCSVRYHL